MTTTKQLLNGDLGIAKQKRLKRQSETLQEQCERLIDEKRALLFALRRADELTNAVIVKMNWGASALDAKTIALLNEVPSEIRKALEFVGWK